MAMVRGRWGVWSLVGGDEEVMAFIGTEKVERRRIRGIKKKRAI